MPCDAYLYDGSCTPLKVPGIQLYANTHHGKNLAGPTNNASIGPTKWGAPLPFPRQQIVYEITAHDPNAYYAPVHIKNLNGAEPGILEIVMLPKAQGGSQMGRPPGTFSSIGVYINLQQWSDDEKRGTWQLVQTVLGVRGTPNSILQGWLNTWERWLRGLDINPDLIIALGPNPQSIRGEGSRLEYRLRDDTKEILLKGPTGAIERVVGQIEKIKAGDDKTDWHFSFTASQLGCRVVA